MRYLVALALLSPAVAQTSPEDIVQRAQELLYLAYMRPDVSRFCSDNQQAIYPIEIQGVTIVVRCASWNDWKNTPKG